MKFKVFLLNSFLLSFSFIFAFNSTTTKIVHADSNPLDFSKENSTNSETFSSKNLIELLINDKISSVESTFLQSQTDTFKYDKLIPQANVSTSINNSILTIYASIYSYTAVNGLQVIWTPYQVNLNDSIKDFSLIDNQYVCEYDYSSFDDSYFEVKYSTTLSLDYNQVNLILNQAYTTASEYESFIQQKEQEYNIAYNQYLLDLQLYEQYLLDLDHYNNVLIPEYNDYLNRKNEYDDKLASYNAYLTELDAYNERLSLYNANQEAWNQYNLDFAAYENYLAEYNSYLSELDTYEVSLEQYNKYMTRINHSFDVMNLLKTPMSPMKRTIYDAIMGDSVTQVLDRKNELSVLGAENYKICLSADKATVALKKLLPAYFSLQTDEERYSFYRSNYFSLKNNFILLFQCLDKLYRNDNIRKTITLTFGEDKLEKLQILIASLGYFSNAISDNDVQWYEGSSEVESSKRVSKVVDENYTFQNETFNQILDYDDVSFSFDFCSQKAYFLNIAYPTMPIKPQEPTKIDRPNPPSERLSAPIKPEEVDDPGQAPEEISKPIMPTKIDKPNPPTPFVANSSLLKLVEAYNNNEINYRTPYTSNIDLTFYSSFNKSLNSENIIDISFYNEDKQLIDTYITEKGSYIVYDHPLPVKNEDVQYKEYKFVCWAYEDGSILDLNNVTKEGCVYPVFEGVKLQQYTITWNIDGLLIQENYEYGSIPSYNGYIYKDYYGNTYYKFKDWDKEITEVTSNKTYEAVFESFPLIQESKDKQATIFYQSSTNTTTINISKYDSFSVDLSTYFKEVIKENTPYNIKIRYNDQYILLNLTSLQTNKLIQSDLAVITVSIDSFEEYEYSYVVNLYDSNGNIINEKIDINAEFVGRFDKNHSSLYSLDDQNNETIVNSVVESNKVNFKMKSNTNYIIYPKYNIFVITNDYVSINIEHLSYKCGEIVSFEPILLQNGIELNEIKVLDSKGNDILFENNSFIMPNDDITISSSYLFIEYVINFYVEGELYSSGIYKYGDQINIPEDPIKHDDEQYSYSFVGWDETIDVVTGNKNYNAIFEATKIVIEEVPEEKRIDYIQIFKTIVASSFAICALGIVIFLLAKIKSSAK